MKLIRRIKRFFSKKPQGVLIVRSSNLSYPPADLAFPKEFARIMGNIYKDEISE